MVHYTNPGRVHGRETGSIPPWLRIVTAAESFEMLRRKYTVL